MRSGEAETPKAERRKGKFLLNYKLKQANVVVVVSFVAVSGRNRRFAPENSAFQIYITINLEFEFEARVLAL